MFNTKRIVDTGFSLYKEVDEVEVPAGAEEVSLSLFENGLNFDKSFIDAYGRAKQEVQVYGNKRVDEARSAAKQRQVSDEIKRSENSVNTLEDIEDLDKRITEINAKGLEIPANWLYDKAQGNLRQQALQDAVDNMPPEQLMSLVDLEKDLEDEIRIKRELEKVEWLTQQAWDEESMLDVAHDIFTSIALPGSDIVNIRLQVGDVIPGHSLSGVVLTAQVLDKMDEVFDSLSTDEKIELIRRIPEASLYAMSKLGLSQNMALNTWTSSLITNTLQEVREDNFTGIETSGDVGLVLFDALEVMGAGELAQFFGTLTRRLFSKAVPKPTMTRTTGRLEKLVKEAGDTADTPSPARSDTARSQQGTLFDVQKMTDPESIGKMIDDLDPADMDVAFEATGINRDQFIQRWMPAIDDTLDPTALPPSAYSRELSSFMRTMRYNSNLTMIGYEATRDLVLRSFQEDFLNVMRGFAHPSRSYLRPPVEADTESLGTQVVMFGENPDRGFRDPRAALTLKNNLKGAGHSAKLIATDDGLFVQAEKTHVLTLKDARPWSSVTGERLTSGFGAGTSWFGRALSPSSYTIKIAEEFHPQRLSSFGVDSSAAIATSAMNVRNAYTKLKSSGNKAKKIMANAVDEAIEYSQQLGRPLDDMELTARFPEIGELGLEAYHADRMFWEAVRLLRSRTYRADLYSKGYKTMAIGDWGFFGKVYAEQPRYREIPVSENGNPVYNDKMETNNIIYGKTAWDPIAEAEFEITNSALKDLYDRGGRIVQLRQLKNVGDSDFSHIVIRDLNRLQVTELPPFVDFGLDFYGGGRRYKDVQYKVVWVNKPGRLNGQDITQRHTLSVVENKAEAKRYKEWAAEKWPDRVLVSERSRELNDALGLSSGSEGYQTYMRHRAQEQPTGGIGRDGRPKKAELVDNEISFQQDMWSIQSENLRKAIEFNEARFIAQFGPFLQKEYSKVFPRGSLAELWDNQKMQRMLTASEIQIKKQDANHLQWYINSMRTEAMHADEALMRNRFANWGRIMGASDNAIAAMASKWLIKGSQASPALHVRGAVSSMYIGLGILYQVPQNILNAAGIVSAQGLKGMSALSDVGWLGNALLFRRHKDVYDAFVKGPVGLAWKLNTTPEIADQFVKNALDSGIFGNAGEVDNIIRYIGEMSVHSNAAANRLRKWTTRLPSTVARASSMAVSKSIDASMLLYWSVAFRRQKKLFEEAGNQIGTADFWEATRHMTRRMSQNQNTSDILNFEKRTNAYAFTLQFMQHILKQGNEIVRLMGKSVGAKVDSAWADSQMQAIRALALLPLAFGAGMFSREGVSFVHDQLPDNIANPTTEVEKALLAAFMGGWIDASIQGAQYALSEDGTSEFVIPVAAKVSPGAMTDEVSKWVKLINYAIDTGQLDIELLSTFGGPTYSAMKNIGSIFGLYPDLTKNQVYDTEEKLKKGIATIAKLGKSFSDIHIAYIAERAGNMYAKQSGNLQGKADAYSVVAKVFGFDTLDVVNKQIDAQWEFFDNKTLEVQAKAIVKELRVLANESVVMYARDANMTDEEFDKRWISFMDQVNDELAHIVELGYPKEKARTMRNFLLKHWSLAVAEDPMLQDLGRRIRRSNSDPIELLRKYRRQPGTTDEDYQQAKELAEAILGRKLEEDE